MITKNNFEHEFGGEVRTFYFGIGFLDLLIKETGVSMESIDEERVKNPVKMLINMMYNSLRYGYIRRGEEPTFVLYDVADWLDEAGGVKSPLVKKFSEDLYKRQYNYSFY